MDTKKEGRPLEDHRKKGPGKWRERFIVDAYLLASEGMNDSEIADYLDVGRLSVILWKKKHPGFKYALRKGREKFENIVSGKPEEGSFKSFVYYRLPAHLKELWDKINACEKEKNGIRRAEALLEENGKYARMHLFLYALPCRKFNVSKACKAVNVSYSEVKEWIKNEEYFGELMDEMMTFHKKNFLEEALMRSVARGDTAAVIFANKTLNADRGYKDKTEVEHTGSITHSHQHSLVNIDELDLPLKIRKAILEAIRLNKAKQIPALEYKVKDTNGKKVAVPVEEE